MTLDNGEKTTSATEGPRATETEGVDVVMKASTKNLIPYKVS